MELLTKQEVIDGAPARFAKQYSKQRWPDRQHTVESLKALEKPIKAADVDAIIGNTSWTELKCDECKQSVDALVQLGAEPDYESSTACVCKKCLRAALKLL